MIWLAFSAMVILLVRFLIVLVNLFTRRTMKNCQMENLPAVSVLIPARNEEANLQRLLDGLLVQDYPFLEIIVYNDDSEDNTAEIISKFTAKDKRIIGIEGKSLPEGWNGKNHACHQLAEQAHGEYLIFVDADVMVRPDLIRKAICYAHENDLTLLSIFPRQLMETLGELLTVPIMNWILLSMLPLRLIRSSHYPSLAAANGQFMLFRGREYNHHHFHELVKDLNVEDIHIMRLIKRLGYRVDTILSKGEVSCRMYSNYDEGIFGFTRSIFTFFGGSGLILFLFTLFTTFGFVFIWVALSWVLALIYLGLAFLLRLAAAAMSQQPYFSIGLLSPLKQFSFVLIVIRSFYFRYTGKNRWKGRTIQFKGI